MEADTHRIESFIDAVIAIVITILVLSLPQPATPTLNGLWDLRIDFLAYLLSFIICYIIWRNYHNLLTIIDKVNDQVLLYLGIYMFGLTLMPYFTIFLAKNFYSLLAQVVYGLVFTYSEISHVWVCKSLAKIEDNPKIDEIIDTPQTILRFIIYALGYIVVFLGYPPGMTISCLMILVTWFIPFNKLPYPFCGEKYRIKK
ncbi:MAG: TMEM175 family protein [Methanobacteriaceae archaeon]|nr:TMEM175 family protein [Methanobacteriaceae archaeon]